MNDKKSEYFWHWVPSFLKGKEIVYTVWGVSQGATLLILAKLHRRHATLFP